jgi:hypothetical protein
MTDPVDPKEVAEAWKIVQHDLAGATFADPLASALETLTDGIPALVAAVNTLTLACALKDEALQQAREEIARLAAALRSNGTTMQ